MKYISFGAIHKILTETFARARAKSVPKIMINEKRMEMSTELLWCYANDSEGFLESWKQNLGILCDSQD